MSAKPKRRPLSKPRPTFASVAEWRDAHGLNQQEAADVLGMSQSLYSRLERGLKRPVGEKAKRIMIATGVPLEVLVGVAS